MLCLAFFSILEHIVIIFSPFYFLVVKVVICKISWIISCSTYGTSFFSSLRKKKKNILFRLIFDVTGIFFFFNHWLLTYSNSLNQTMPSYLEVSIFCYLWGYSCFIFSQFIRIALQVVLVSATIFVKEKFLEMWHISVL